MTMTQIAVQTAVNDIYRTALIELVTASSRPLDNADLCDGILGGVMPAEMAAGAMEPFVPAQLSLVSNGTFAYWADPNTGVMYTSLFDRATPEQQELSLNQTREQEATMDTVNYDDPTNHRLPARELAKTLAAQQNELRDVIAAAISSTSDGNERAVH
ncbi:hypothetical protein CMI47_04630 [Candidatus Pacearchaeota archaeon]|jgi:hypothetical protein|nr:hypothetical protein [Candidatus Pacearchaeota archaeon]|tara:strand:- start:3839 stop:4312 length:474 start_codon:yes stop_codon:yes gene_type:complete